MLPCLLPSFSAFRTTTRLCSLSIVGMILTLSLAGIVTAQTAPDLTTADLNKLDTRRTYNLGPTGMRGWIYTEFNNPLALGPKGIQTSFPPYQILVTHVGKATPAEGVLTVQDLILGVAWGPGSSPVPPFANDCRKALGVAIGEAEKTESRGILRLRRMRAGTIEDVQITLPVMGTYSPTAPFNCPKSARILANATARLKTEPLTDSWCGSVTALAKLAVGDPDDAPALKKLAGDIAAKSFSFPPIRELSAWDLGYNAIFLAEYYLATGDAEVLPGIRNYAVTVSRGQSAYGTFGHGTALPKVDGSDNGSVPWYGPVNNAALAANLGLVLCRNALQAGGEPIPPQVEPAISRAASFFSYYVQKGGIPYGEHATWLCHADNGKSGLAALMFANMGHQPTQTQYYARMCIAAYTGEEYGHTGQGFSYLWTTLGAAIGGDEAAAAYFHEVQWRRDLARRCDGSFTYDGAEQYGGSEAKDYWSPTSYNGLSPTAAYVLHFSLPKHALSITGKNARPAHELSKVAVANAVAAGIFDQQCDRLSLDQLLEACAEFDPMVRDAAATELGRRTQDHATLRPRLIAMTEDSKDPARRAAACQALGQMPSPDCLPALSRCLRDKDAWVRTRAAEALTRLGDSATPALPAMIAAFAANATDPMVIVWDDPLQLANGTLAQPLFQTPSFRSELRKLPPDVYRNLIAIGLRQPDSRARGSLKSLIREDLTWEDVQALAPDLVQVTRERAPANRMFAEPIRYAGLAALGKYKVEEVIPLCLLVKEQNWHTDEWEPFEVLRNMYGSAAAEALPTLLDWQKNLPQFDADRSISGKRLASITQNIASTIAALSAPATPAPLNFFKSITTPTVAPIGNNQVRLTAQATDLDGGNPRITWSKVSGPGEISFSSNSSPESTTTVATFEVPGVYVVRVAAADQTILNELMWNASKTTGHEFHTWLRDVGTVSNTCTIVVRAGQNWPPNAYDQTAETAPATPRPLQLVGFDFDGDSLTYTIVTPPAHGSLSGQPPTVTYTPAAGFIGTDTFTFSATDSHKLASLPATVHLSVRNPIAINIRFLGWTGKSAVAADDDATLVGAAGAAAAGRWNQLTDGKQSPPLLAADGTATDVRIATTASLGYVMGQSPLPMMRAAVSHHGKGQDTRVTLSGLQPLRHYRVWIMSHSSSPQAPERTHGIWSTANPATGPAQQTIDGVSALNDTAWQAGTNFVLFAQVQADADGTLSFLGDATDAGERPTDLAYRLQLNGIQLIESPVPPAAPTDLTAEARDNCVHLTWQPVVGAGSYLVRRTDGTGKPPTLRGAPTATHFTDSPAANGQSWHYTVTAQHPLLAGIPSAEVSATPRMLPRPIPPESVQATAGQGTVSLSWKLSPTAYSYIIRRASRPGGPYSTLATMEATTNTFEDTTVRNNQPWYYTIVAVNLTGESQPADEVIAVPRSVEQVVHVNFTRTAPADSATLAGPAGGAGETWNNVTTFSTQTPIVDANGAATRISIKTTASAGESWGNPQLPLLASAFCHFGKGLDTAVTLTGLSPGAQYRIWLVSHNQGGGDEGAHGTWATANATSSPNAQALDGVTTTSGSAFVNGANYVSFDFVVADPTGTIRFAGDASDPGDFHPTKAYRLPLNGLQIWKYSPIAPPP